MPNAALSAIKTERACMGEASSSAAGSHQLAVYLITSEKWERTPARQACVTGT
jgi:hypothetical protein